MGSSERRARARVALRQQILDAARELFISEGYDAVSMRRIADRIEYSPTAIYLHFADKQALFTALCEETFEKLAVKLEAIARRDGDPMALLREGLLLYVDFGLKHPHHYTVTFLIKARGEAPAFEGSAGARAFGVLHAAVAGAMEAGRLRRGDVDTVSQSLWAACHGIVALLVTMKAGSFPFVPARRLATHTIDTMLAGLKA